MLHGPTDKQKTDASKRSMIVNYHFRFVVTNNSKVANYNRKEFIRFATEAKRKMFFIEDKIFND